jgi:transcriptional regulator NrdR family protein
MNPKATHLSGMKCLECGATTSVKATRSEDNNVTRIRECYNNHRFYTQETAIKMIKRYSVGRDK